MNKNDGMEKRVSDQEKRISKLEKLVSALLTENRKLTVKVKRQADSISRLEHTVEVLSRRP